MATFYTDSGSFNGLQVSGSSLISGSLIVSGSTNILGSLTLNGSPVNTSAGTVTKGFVIAMASAM